MKGVTTVWLNDFPENKLSVEEKEITESEEVQGGGLIEILNFIIKKLTTESDGYDFMENLREAGYKQGDEKNDFAKTQYCSGFLTEKYHYLGSIIIGIEAEARFIVATVFKYVQKLEFLKNEERILDILEQGGWTKEEVARPTRIAEKILAQELKKIKTNTGFLKLTSDYIESYFETKAQHIRTVTLEKAEVFFKNRNLSSNKFKAIARSLGASNDELQELIRYRTSSNTKGLETFLIKSRVASGSTDDVLKKMYQSNKELKSFIGTNTKSIKNLVRKGGYAKKFVKFLSKDAFSLGLPDSLISLESAYEPEKMMDNMLSSAGAVVSASVGFGVSALLALGNDHYDRLEENSFEDIYNSCGISWADLCRMDEDGVNFKTKQFKRLFFQYKKEEHILFSNKKVVPTSIRILDAEKAKEMFGFIPKYVNYFLVEDQELSEVCCTKYN